MKKTLIRLIEYITALLLLSGCTAGEMQALNEGLEQANRDIARQNTMYYGNYYGSGSYSSSYSSSSYSSSPSRYNGVNRSCKQRCQERYESCMDRKDSPIPSCSDRYFSCTNNCY